METSKGKKEIDMEMEKQMFGKKKKKSLLDHAKTMGHRVDLNL